MQLSFSSLFAKVRQALSIVTCSILLFALTPNAADANFNVLVPCKESPAFQKRLNSSVKKLENRLKL